MDELVLSHDSWSTQTNMISSQSGRAHSSLAVQQLHDIKFRVQSKKKLRLKYGSYLSLLKNDQQKALRQNFGGHLKSMWPLKVSVTSIHPTTSFAHRKVMVQSLSATTPKLWCSLQVCIMASLHGGHLKTDGVTGSLQCSLQKCSSTTVAIFEYGGNIYCPYYSGHLMWLECAES